MNKYNKNKHRVISIRSKTYIQKKYDDINRFNCEIKYVKLFKKKGFLVPNIYASDKKGRTVTLGIVEGNIYEKLDNKRLKLCIALLVKIISIFGLEKDNNKERKKYMIKIKENIRGWCIQNNLQYNSKNLNRILNDLESVCFISLFKDAKPTNWIFRKTKVYMIDFDYVKKSFFMADLAQLMSYVDFKRRVDNFSYINLFLNELFPGIKNIEKYYNPFMLAVVNSNIATILHNDSLPNGVKRNFDNSNKRVLKQLNILK